MLRRWIQSGFRKTRGFAAGRRAVVLPGSRGIGAFRASRRRQLELMDQRLNGFRHE